ncbi:hypothetical protein CTI14_37935, partial [Methylobacterium radiotolerans]
MSSDMFFLSPCGCSGAVSGWDMGILSSSGDAFILPRAGVACSGFPRAPKEIRDRSALGRKGQPAFFADAA